MCYTVNSKSKQTWRNAHPRVLLSAVRKDLLRESGKKRRDRARSRKYRQVQQIMIGADRWKELKLWKQGSVKVGNLVLSYRSEAHDMPSTHVCLHLAVKQLESRDHYTVHHFRGVKMAESKRVGSRLMSFILLFDCQEAFHCCLVVACSNRINMISIQCHRVGEWSAGKPECGNCIVPVWGNHDYAGLNEVAIPLKRDRS